MGEYTEFLFTADLEVDLPQGVIDTLDYMSRFAIDDFFGVEGTPKLDESSIPVHPFFASPRWRLFFASDSSYFPNAPVHSFTPSGIFSNYQLNVHSNMKNYHNEVEEFIDWISPYVKTSHFYEDEDVDKGIFVGYYRDRDMNVPVMLFVPVK